MTEPDQVLGGRTAGQHRQVATGEEGVGPVAACPQRGVDDPDLGVGQPVQLGGGHAGLDEGSDVVEHFAGEDAGG